ncbi:hypothetical protein MAM1_0029d02278 [Mucor ambiguus]|uniref:Uncharacterized protein n=1 Tax=Mucor ambiguus TaxID=91626 RepID=A0A0C9M2C2_9FUNG|nr:hypothetical protein MAM1_0029d02278 [Mucor ambiguus]
MFASLPQSTHATLPGIIEEEGKSPALVADLHRQIEHLQFQMTVVNERNQHVELELVAMRTTSMELWSLNDKQSALIDALESKLNQTADMKREMRQLELERHAMEDNLQVVQDIALKQDKDTERALEAVAMLQKQLQQQQNMTHTNTNGGSLDQQRTRALENRVEELNNYIVNLQRHHTHQEETERWRHTAQLQAAKINAFEKRIDSLQNELLTHQTALREGDTSGIIASLQDRIKRLQQEKTAVEDDFESSYEAAVNENDKLTQLANQQSYQIQQLETAVAELHQQLSKQQSIKQAYDALRKEYELMEKLNQELVVVNKQPHSVANRQSTTSVASVYRKRRTPNRISVDEKPQLMRWIQEKLDTSCTMDVLQKVSHLADENMQLALMVDDLETQIMSQRHHLSQQVKTLECDVLNLTVLNNQLERQTETSVRLSRSSAATNSTHRIRRGDTPASVLSDYTAIKYRSTTPSLLPPTEPPNQPLPPTPPVSEQFDTQLRSYHIKLEMAENQVRTQQEQTRKLASGMEELQDQHIQIQKELELERRQRQKAEQAHAILEKRLQDVMNDKKNKFLCF